MWSPDSPLSNIFATSLWLGFTATLPWPLPTPCTPFCTNPVVYKAPIPALLHWSSALVQPSSDSIAPWIMTSLFCLHASCALLQNGQSEPTPGSCTLQVLLHGGRKSARYLPSPAGITPMRTFSLRIFTGGTCFSQPYGCARLPLFEIYV